MASLNDKFRAGYVNYLQSPDGSEIMTGNDYLDGEGKKLDLDGMERVTPKYYADPDGNEYAVSDSAMPEFAENNVREGRKVMPMVEMVHDKGPSVRVNAYDQERIKYMKANGWRDKLDAEPGLAEILADKKTWDWYKDPENLKTLPENMLRGGGAALAEGLNKGLATVGNLALAGGAFVADHLGARSVAKSLRQMSRNLHELSAQWSDSIYERYLGEDFADTDRAKELAKKAIGGIGELGGIYALGGPTRLGGGILGKLGLSARAAETATMAGLFGMQGFEKQLANQEAQGKEAYTARSVAAATFAGATQAFTGALYGKLYGLIGREAAGRAIRETYGKMMGRAILDTFEGGILGAANAAADAGAKAIAGDDVDWKKVPLEMLTNFFVGSATVAMTKIPTALGLEIRKARKRYAQAVEAQGMQVLITEEAGIPFAANRESCPDVLAPTINREVAFKDGTVFRPRVIKTPEGVKYSAEIVTADGTILNGQGKVIGKCANRLEYLTAAKGEVRTPAEFLYRQLDPEAANAWRTVDADTGLVTDESVAWMDRMPESVKRWRAWNEGGRQGPAPEIDAEGVAFVSLYNEAAAEGRDNLSRSRAAQIALEAVKEGRMGYVEAAELTDNAYRATEGRVRSLFGAYMRSRSAGEGANNADGPAAAKTQMIAPLEGRYAPKAEAMRQGGALPEAVVDNAKDIVKMIHDGTIEAQTVDVTAIVDYRGRPTEGPLIVRENGDGKYEVVSGKLPEGAKTVKAVIVREEDGWTRANAQAIADEANLAEGALTPAEETKANRRTGRPDATGDKLSAENLERLTDDNLEAMTTLGAVVNLATIGKGWDKLQNELAEVMPEGADAPTIGLAAELKVNNPDLAATEAWELAAWARRNGVAARGAEEIRQAMAADAAGHMAVVQPDGEIATVDELEARAGVDKPVDNSITVSESVGEWGENPDHTFDMSPVEGLDGVFEVARFPEMQVCTGEGGFLLRGLTPQLMLDRRNRHDMGRFLDQLQARAADNDLVVDLGDPALVEVAQELVENYRYEHREENLKQRTLAAVKVLEKSNLADVTMDEAEFEAALAKYPEGRRYIADGKTWGFFDGRKIYLNRTALGTGIGLNTAIHEFAHPAVTALKKVNPQMYSRMVELAGETKYFEALKASADYAGYSRELLAEEAWVRLIADWGTERVKSNVPAKIYKEVDELVRRFAARFGAETLGVRDFTPAMMATWTIEDYVEAVGSELLAGRPFGSKPPSAHALAAINRLSRYLGYRNPGTPAAKAAWQEVRAAWKGLDANADAKAEIRALAEAGVHNSARARRLAQELQKLIKWDDQRQATAKRMRALAKRNPTAAQQEILKRSLKNYIERGAINPYGALGFLERNQATGIMAIPANKDNPLWDWWRNFTDGMDWKTRRQWMRVLGGKNYKKSNEPGAIGNDHLLERYLDFLNGDARRDSGSARAEERLSLEEFMDQLVEEYGEYQEWKRQGAESLDEKRAREEYEAYMADVFPEGDAAAAERAELELLADADRDARREAERMGEYEQFEEPRFSIGGLYTGSAADYEKPSLQKVGTGEGNQVYGWGLYASTKKSVAMDYATADANRKRGRRQYLVADVSFDGKPARDNEKLFNEHLGLISNLENWGSVDTVLRNYEFYDSRGKLREYEKEDYEFLKKNLSRFELKENKPHPEYLYEQTFFTDREPGDESHLLKWYEPVSKEQLGWIESALKKEGLDVNDFRRYMEVHEHDGEITGQSAYQAIGKIFESSTGYSGRDKAASEFLARAGIDGVKYPVDSYGGKTVKDGDKAGWNYVSFRDDNIRVDHKWVDGQIRFARAIVGGKTVAVVDDIAGAAKINARNPHSVEAYVLDHLENNIEMLAGGTASITEKSAQHLAWSKTRGFDGRQMRQARAKAATVIADLIKMFTADSSTKEAPKKGKGGIAWRCRLPIAIPKLDNKRDVIGAVGYDADVVIKDEGDGKFFYDISHLKQNGTLTGLLDKQKDILFGSQNTALPPSQAGSASGVPTVNSIPYSGAKSQGESFKFSRPITPAEDTAYMDAVRRGDMETAERMVREAAAREMPNAKVVGDDREPLKVYHATDNDFTVFDKRRLGEFTDKNAVDDAAKQLARLGFWFNEKDLHKQIWAKKAVGAYLNITNPYDTSLDELWRELREQKAESFVSDLKAWGYDGIVLDDSEFGGKSFVAFEPNQIKSADPVTYDDAGNVISLSQRFNDRNADLRFARAGEGERKSRFVAGKVRVITPPEGMGEQEPGILATSVELANRETPPAMAARRARKLSLSMSELEWLRKKLTGDLGDQVVGKKSSARAKGLALNADVFGLVDRTDMEQLKRELKAAGYFRNEEAAFCQAANKEGVRAERERSEAALADRLNALAEARVKGEAAGGQAAARGIFADMLGKVITRLPLDGMPVNLKSLRSLGDALKAATKDQAFKLEAMGAMPERASALEPEPTDSEICARMVATYLISPESMEHATPKWFGAIEDVLLRNDKLRGAMEELLAGAEEGRGAGAIALEKIRREQRGEVERIQRELFAEINEPIQRPGVMKQLQEKVLVAFHDKMAPVILRVDDRAKLYLKAAKEALKTAKTPAEVRAARDELDRFTQGLLSAKKRLMLARGAWERGAWNDDSRYLYKMLELENDATERWGLDDGEISNFMFLERTVELGGRAVSHGLTVRDAQRELDRIKAETPEKYARLDEYAQKFHAIVEQEVIDNPAMRRMFGDQFMDFLKTQTHYVTMRRTLNAEQLEWYRERLKEAGVQATDDIYDKLERWTNRRGGQGADGGDFTATLAGSMSAKAEVRGATMEKHLRAFRSVRKNDYVLAMKDLLVENGVEGVKVLPRGAYKSNGRYGFLNFMEKGQKFTLQVPKDIAAGFEHDALDGAGIIRKFHGLVRSLYIDWNFGYWLNNINRNTSSIEKNMPGMREPWVKTALRATAPGGAPLFELATNALARRLSEGSVAHKALTLLVGKHAPAAFIPEAKRIAEYIMEPSTWQEQLWKAEQAGDREMVQQLLQDRDKAWEMLKGNMLVTGAAGHGDVDTAKIDELFGKRGLKTIQERRRQEEKHEKLGAIILKYAAKPFKANQRQQEYEDVLAKTIGYLHDRMAFGDVRSVEETGALVGDKVSIKRGERKGSMNGVVQLMVNQFYNQVEKGTVAFYKNFTEGPGKTRAAAAGKAAQVWLSSLLGTLASMGMLSKFMLAQSDDDEQKAKEKYGKAWEYAKHLERGRANMSNYLKHNYNLVPILNVGDYTTVSIGLARSDEDKIIGAYSDLMAEFINSRLGGPDVDMLSAAGNLAMQGMVPDFQANTPVMNLLQDTVEILRNNPYDSFRGAEKFDRDTYRLRGESGEMFGNFAVVAGMNLWNDLGGRAFIEPEVGGRAVPEPGVGAPPEAAGVVAGVRTLHTALKRLPVVGPALKRMIKISVGRPKGHEAGLVDDDADKLALVRVLTKDALKECRKRGKLWVEADPEGYYRWLEDKARQYGLERYYVDKLDADIWNDYLDGPESRLEREKREIENIRQRLER